MAAWRSLAAAVAAVAAAAVWAGAAQAQTAPGTQLGPAAQQPVKDSPVYVSVTPAWVQPGERSGTVAGNQVTIDYESGVGVSAAVGANLRGGFRVEGELSYLNAEVDTLTVNGQSVTAAGDVDMVAGAVNAYYDINTRTPFRPYVGGGFGIAHVSRSVQSAAAVTLDNESDTDIMLQGEVGLGVKITQTFIVTPAYRYTHVFDGEGGIDDSAVHSFRLGARTEF